MPHSPGTRSVAFAIGLLFAASGSALAQDTTETGRAAIDTTAPEAGAIDTAGVDTAGVDTAATRDTTDTSGVQNPPGYRGMERDTTIFPDAGGPPADANQAKGQTTGVYGDTAWSDTTGAAQNPPGYRGMERPVGEGEDTTAQDTTAVGDTEPKEEDSATPRLDPSESPAAGDTVGQSPDSAQ
jgi:hypothetical protein